MAPLPQQTVRVCMTVLRSLQTLLVVLATVFNITMISMAFAFSMEEQKSAALYAYRAALVVKGLLDVIMCGLSLFLAITWMLAQCTKKAAMSSSTYVRNMTACTCCKRSVAWDDIIAVYWALTLVWTAVGGAWAGAIYSGFALASFVITAVLSRQVRDYKPEAGRYNELSTSELLGVSTADSRPLAAPPAGALPA